MKKIVEKINTTAGRSVIAGVVLAIAGISAYGIIASESRVSVVDGDQALTRIGSLVAGEYSDENGAWLKGQNEEVYGLNGCLNNEEVRDDSIIQTCLQADAWFDQLVVDQDAEILGRAFAGVRSDGGFTDVDQEFVVYDNAATDQDSIMVSSLQYRNTAGTFAPRDAVTQRGVCADANGVLYACGGTVGLPETYSWVTGEWGACTAAGAGSCSGSYVSSLDYERVWIDNTPFLWTHGMVYDQNKVRRGSAYSTDGSGTCSGCIVNQEYYRPVFRDVTYHDPQTYDSYDDYEIDGHGSLTEEEFNDLLNDSEGEVIIGEVQYPRNSEWYKAVWNGSRFVKSGTCSADVWCGDTEPSDAITATQAERFSSYFDCPDTFSCRNIYTPTAQICSGSTESSCVSEDSSCTWLNAGESIQSRTVTCQDSSGGIVDDSLCSVVGVKPNESQNCGSEASCYWDMPWDMCFPIESL